MGFRVEMREVRQAEAGFKRSAEVVARSLAGVRGAFNGVIGSGALSGELGRAVVSMVNNGHCAVVTALIDCYESLGQAYERAVADFVCAVGERDGNAVIDSGVLEGFKRSLSVLGAEKEGFDREFRRIYNSIDDIVPLPLPSGAFADRREDVVRDVDDVLRRVGEFDVAVLGSELESFVADVARQVKRVGGVSALPVGDRRASEVFSDSGFADGVAESHEWVRARREEVLKKAMERWVKQHPVDSFAGEQAWRQEFEAFMGEVNARMSDRVFVGGQAIDFVLGLQEDIVKREFAKAGAWVKGPWGRVLKAVPVAGSFVDFAVQVGGGERWYHALAKTGLHAGVGIGAGAAVGGSAAGPIGLIVGAASGNALGLIFNPVVDAFYDRVVKGEPQGDVGVSVQAELRGVDWLAVKGLGRVRSGLVFGGVAGR